MKIIDAFIFSNEIDILKGRLEYLYNIVDYFVIVESNITFSGLERELLYPKIIKECKPFEDKILYFPVTLNSVLNNDFVPDFNYDFPKYNSSAWIREQQIRDHILIVLSLFNDNDILMISDVDEIPRKEFIIKAIDKIKTESCVSFIHDIIFYNLNFKDIIQCYGTVLSTVEYSKRNSIENLRRQRFGMSIIENGGWHLQSWFSPKGIQNKIKSCSHQELNTETFNNPFRLLKCMQEGKSIFENQLITINSDYYPKDFYDVFVKYSKNYVTIED